MPEKTQTVAGTIGWHDLTVDDAEGVRAFYEAVAGWKPGPVDMGGYQDWCMTPPGADAPVGGICHKRGGNAGLPSQWLMYINVDDLDASMEKCAANGGEVIAGPKQAGGMGRYCVIRDPAGAVAGLFEPA